MTTEALTLAGFVLARIAERESAARSAAEASGPDWTTRPLLDGWGVEGRGRRGHPRADPGDPSLWDDEGALGMYRATAEHVARHDPSRVLADCEAKRRIVELRYSWNLQAERMSEPPFGPILQTQVNTADAVLRCLALPYADHPDYQQEWRP